MTISSLLQNPFEMIPSSSSVNLVRLHLGEVRFHAMKAAEVEESSNRPQRVHSRPINRPSSPAFMSPNASRLYSAAVTNGSNSTTSLSPERVFLSSIPVNGPSRQDAIAASTGYRLNMDLHSSSSHHVVGFCFLPPPELADMNYAAGHIPDLNLPPSDVSNVSASGLVLRTKNRNILRFIDAVRSLVVKHGSPEELAEYMKNKSSLTNPLHHLNHSPLSTSKLSLCLCKLTELLDTAGMANFLKKPFKMSPNSRVNLVHFHLEEVRVLLPDHPFNRASPNGGCRPQRLYSAAVNGTGNTSLCPERVFVTRIPLLTGPTPEDAAAAVIQFRLNLALNSSSSHHQFCFLGNGTAADNGGQNYVDPAPNRGPNYIPDLNVSQPDETAPTTEFVGVIKSQNISRFTDYVVWYLGEYGSDEGVAEYRKILSSKSEGEIGNLDSIQIWNILTLEAEIQKALVTKGLVEAPMRFDDLQFPAPEELLPIPEKGGKAAKRARYCGVVGIDEPKSPIPEAGDSDSSE